MKKQKQYRKLMKQKAGFLKSLIKLTNFYQSCQKRQGNIQIPNIRNEQGYQYSPHKPQRDNK